MIAENESSGVRPASGAGPAHARSPASSTPPCCSARRKTRSAAEPVSRPGAFAGVTASPTVRSQRPVGGSRFVAPLESDATGTRVRAGLIDESAKLNLNAISSFGLEEEQEQHADQHPRHDRGDRRRDPRLDRRGRRPARSPAPKATSTKSLTPPYSARNAALESLDELLLVQGVTPQLLYGEDANRNGLLDPNENDGDASLPLDNADGLLDPGWAAYFTVDSRESNLRADGADKIDVNQDLLADMYDQINEELGEDEALFITAYRIYGATNVDPLDERHRPVQLVNRQSADRRGAAERCRRAGAGDLRRRGGRSRVPVSISRREGHATFDSLFELSTPRSKPRSTSRRKPSRARGAALAIRIRSRRCSTR